MKKQAKKLVALLAAIVITGTATAQFSSPDDAVDFLDQCYKKFPEVYDKTDAQLFGKEGVREGDRKYNQVFVSLRGSNLVIQAVQQDPVTFANKVHVTIEVNVIDLAKVTSIDDGLLEGKKIYSNGISCYEYYLQKWTQQYITIKNMPKATLDTALTGLDYTTEFDRKNNGTPSYSIYRYTDISSSEMASFLNGNGTRGESSIINNSSYGNRLKAAFQYLINYFNPSAQQSQTNNNSYTNNNGYQTAATNNNSTPASNENDPDNQFQMGLNYYNGKHGYPQDYNKAVYWWQKAVAQGNANAQYFLGVCYLHGYGGLAQSATKAVYWYQKSADQGYMYAQGNLGICYENGEDGLPKDLDKAVYWYKKAAAQGDDYSQDALKRLGK